VLCMSLAFIQIFYLAYYYGYVGNRAVEAVGTIFGITVETIRFSMVSAAKIIEKHFFTYPTIAIYVCCVIFLIISKQKIILNKHALHIFAASILYSFIIIFVAPGKTLRYIMPVFPFFIIMPAAIIDQIKKQKISTIVMLVLCILFSVNALKESKIQNIYKDKPSKYLFSNDVDVPVFVINSSPWKYADLVPYFNDTQIYFFNNKYEDMLPILAQHNEFYLVVENTFAIPESILTQFTIMQDFSVSMFRCKKFKMISNPL